MLTLITVFLNNPKGLLVTLYKIFIPYFKNFMPSQGLKFVLLDSTNKHIHVNLHLRNRKFPFLSPSFGVM